MSSSLTAEQSTFISRYIDAKTGAQVEETAKDDLFPAIWRSAVKSWQTSSELVDQQVTNLQSHLRQASDPRLNDIAEFGLNALTGNHKVPVLAAIREIDAAQPSPDLNTLSDAAIAFSALESHLANDARVAACDNNPFGVKMNIAATLGAGLQKLNAALSKANQ